MKALVIGAAGGFGGAVARELVRRGHETTALVRPGGRDPDIDGLWQVTGDALDRSAVARGSEGMDVIVFGFNVPYPQWETKAIAAIENVAAVAEKTGATIIFPGNVYGLGADFSVPLAEDCDREAPTALGQIRNRMEARLGDATKRGARTIIVRAGDYFGGNGTNTWFEHITRKAIGGGAILNPAPADVPHAWAYLPDVARATVTLAEQRHRLDAFTQYHFAGYALASQQMVAAIQRVLGECKVNAFPWWPLRLVSPFWSMGRALLAMRYLWTQPVLLDDTKLRKAIGSDLLTPLDQAVATSIAAMQMETFTTSTGHGNVPAKTIGRHATT